MYKIATLYKFSRIQNPLKTHKDICSNLKELNIKGTILVGEEGLNGTICATSEKKLSKAIKYLQSIDGFDALDVKYSSSEKNPFVRMKVKLKKEIVTIGDNSIDPTEMVGEYVDPNNWNKLIDDKNTILIDTRNNYEYSIGTFKNSINPHTNKFREFPKWIKKQKFSNKDKESKNIAMFCTGGIRCEKASVYLEKKGFKNIYQLKGGILNYLKKIKQKNSLWKGECFVFDNRVSLKHGLAQGTYSICGGCREPISVKDKKSRKYEEGVTCPSCFSKLSKKQKSRFRMRQSQIYKAKLSGKKYNFQKEFN